MGDLHPNADKRRRETVERVVEQFDSTLLADHVREQLQYGHNDILRVANAMAYCYALGEDEHREDGVGDATATTAFGAAEDLRERLDVEAERAVAEILQEVVDEPEAVTEYYEERGPPAVAEAERILDEATLPTPAGGVA